MLVTVINLKGLKINIEINESGTIGELRQKYAKRINEDAERLQLKLDGETLQDYQKLSDLEIDEEVLIQSNDKFLGGKHI